MDIATIFNRKIEAKEMAEQTAWSKYRQILARYDRPHTGDDAAMEKIIEVLGLTQKQIETDAATIRKANQLKALAERDWQQLTATWAKAVADIADYEREAKAKSHELFMVKARADAAKYETLEAKTDLARLKKSNPKLFE